MYRPKDRTTALYVQTGYLGSLEQITYRNLSNYIVLLVSDPITEPLKTCDVMLVGAGWWGVGLLSILRNWLHVVNIVVECLFVN
jgi:hypothetical protein